MAAKLTKPITRELPPTVYDGRCPCCGEKDPCGPQTYLVTLSPAGSPEGEPSFLIRRKGERRAQRLTLKQVVELSYRWGTRVILEKKKPFPARPPKPPPALASPSREAGARGLFDAVRT